MYAIVVPFALYLIVAIWSHIVLAIQIAALWGDSKAQLSTAGSIFGQLAFIGVIATWVIFFV